MSANLDLGFTSCKESLTNNSPSSITIEMCSTEHSTYKCNTCLIRQKLIELGSDISHLNSQNELSPGPTANFLFGSIVQLVLNSQKYLSKKQIQLILTHPTIKYLQPIIWAKSSQAEFYMELHYSKEIVSQRMKLTEFLYYENYKQLAKFEVECLLNYLGENNFNKIKHVAFIGSGPLPLSSIELLPYFPADTAIVNYDLDENAIELGKSIVEQELLESTSISTAATAKQMHFIQMNALDINSLLSADIVYLAALVGKNSVEKNLIISHLYSIMKPGSVLIARSATGLCELLYQKLTKEHFGDFIDYKHFNPIDRNIINSIAIVRKLATLKSFRG